MSEFVSVCLCVCDLCLLLLYHVFIVCFFWRRVLCTVFVVESRVPVMIIQSMMATVHRPQPMGLQKAFLPMIDLPSISSFSSCQLTGLAPSSNHQT